MRLLRKIVPDAAGEFVIEPKSERVFRRTLAARQRSLRAGSFVSRRELVNDCRARLADNLILGIRPPEQPIAPIITP